MLVWFVISCLLFVGVLIAFIVILALPPKQTTNPPPLPLLDTRPGFSSGIAQAFANSDGKIIVSPNKPIDFQIVKDGPIRNAFVFSDLTRPGFPLLVNTVSTSRGFSFEVTEPMSIVSMQIIDQLFDSGSRIVGIYNLNTRILLYSTSISKTMDVLVSGFRTHGFQPNEYVELTPGILYALVASVQVNDRYVNISGFAQPINFVKMAPFFSSEGSMGSVASNSLALPSNFSSSFSLMSPFASFQVQQRALLQSVFSIDTQYARFPSEYLNGFTVSVLPDNVVVAGPGLAADAFTRANLVSTQNLTAGNITLLPNIWYAVFTSADNMAGTNTSLVLSPNASQPENILFYRRIGWVRSKLLTAELYQSEQTGSGIRRITTYLEDAIQEVRTVTTGVPITMELGLVPPSTTECTMQIAVEFDPLGTLPSDFFEGKLDIIFQQVVFSQAVTFTVNQSSQIGLISFPINSSRIPPQVTITLNWGGVGVPDPVCTFRILSYVEDL